MSFKHIAVYLFFWIICHMKCILQMKLKKGLYACSYHHGPYEETDATYKELLTYIDKEGYEVHGDSIEIGLIDWSVTENPEEQVTEIQIPVVKNKMNTFELITNLHSLV